MVDDTRSGPEPRRIGVLWGGPAAARDAALRAGEAVAAALSRGGHEVQRLFVDRDIDQVLRRADIDVAFLAAAGPFGEDGSLQGLLELLGIPYTGSGVLASAVARDKVKAKELLRLHNLPTPPYYVAGERALDRIEREHGAFGLPVVVKPTAGGQGVGVSLVGDLGDLRDACEDALRLSRECLVERYVPGREVTVAVLCGRAVGAAEVVPRGADPCAARLPERIDLFAPPRMASERRLAALRMSERACAAIGCAGLALVDLIVDDRGHEAILEVNAHPAIAPDSLAPRVLSASEVGFDDLCALLLADARLHGGAPGADRRARRVAPPGPDRRTGVAAN